jgi:hydroxypyruvate reductase
MRRQKPLVLLAAGTDGTDGPAGAAGALVDPGTVSRGNARGLEARHCLNGADAGSFLEASGDLLVTGPTGTNVTDLVIALKGNPA